MKRQETRSKNLLILFLVACSLLASVVYLIRSRLPAGATLTEDWHRRYGDVIQQAGQAVVAIETTQPSPIRNLTFKHAGSGFIIDTAGVILTNEHIIHEASSIRVTLADRRTVIALLLGSDVRTDIALLKIEADALTALTIAEPGVIAQGMPVIALGNPLGTGADGQAVTTFGHINRLDQRLDDSVDPGNDRFYDNLIQSTAITLPGSSGGPLINEQGQAIGINTATATTITTGQQFGFAIALDRKTLDLIDLLLVGSEIQHAFLGLELADQIDESTCRQLGLKDLSGALVQSVMLGFPAQRAGLRSGDVIRGIDGQRIYNRNDLMSRLNSCVPNTPVQLELLRGRRGVPDVSDQLLLSVTPTIRKISDLKGYQAEAALNYVTAWGMAVKPLTTWRKDKLQLPVTQTGVLVYHVQPDSPADQKGVTPGSVITAIGNRSVNNLRDFHRLANRLAQMPPLTTIPPDPSLNWF